MTTVLVNPPMAHKNLAQTSNQNTMKYFQQNVPHRKKQVFFFLKKKKIILRKKKRTYMP